MEIKFHRWPETLQSELWRIWQSTTVFYLYAEVVTTFAFLFKKTVEGNVMVSDLKLHMSTSMSFKFICQDIYLFCSELLEVNLL